ncbi:hypothetical protein PCO31110_02440 [Pandoraea communis]|uniref:Uncharacterized protein n=1 Tax=Pandoraea communis TaxID=2508297 RepID=A0A5E4V3K9_9BURK|nr:hypothetical protein [Pandoraea communis]VVE06862.1 hypothetical protein PCO31110_02440 [Pandoraea communis]
MTRYEPLIWLALSVVGLYALRRLYRRGFNLYDPVLTEKESRRRDIRFAAFVVLYIAAAVGSFFAKQ